MTHICLSKLTIISSYNGLSPGRRQAIIWTNDGILLIGPPEKKLLWIFNRNLYIFIQENAFEYVVLKMAAILSRPQCVKRKMTYVSNADVLPQDVSHTFRWHSWASVLCLPVLRLAYCYLNPGRCIQKYTVVQVGRIDALSLIDN